MHIADDSKQILSGVLIEINEELLENYTKLRTRLYTISLNHVYIHNKLGNVPTTENDRIKEGIQVHNKQFVGFDTTRQRHMLWSKILSKVISHYFHLKIYYQSCVCIGIV